MTSFYVAVNNSVSLYSILPVNNSVSLYSILPVLLI